MRHKLTVTAVTQAVKDDTAEKEKTGLSASSGIWKRPSWSDRRSNKSRWRRSVRPCIAGAMRLCRWTAAESPGTEEKKRIRLPRNWERISEASKFGYSRQLSQADIFGRIACDGEKIEAVTTEVRRTRQHSRVSLHPHSEEHHQDAQDSRLRRFDGSGRRFRDSTMSWHTGSTASAEDRGQQRFARSATCCRHPASFPWDAVPHVSMVREKIKMLRRWQGTKVQGLSQE